MRTALLVVLAAVCVAPASASASTTIDIRGKFVATSEAHSTTYSGEDVIETEDCAAGTFSGHGHGGGYTWTSTGTIDGNKVTEHQVYNEVSYSSDTVGTVSDDGSHNAGTFHDSNNTDGTYDSTRVESGPNDGGCKQAEPPPPPPPDTRRPTTLGIFCNRGPQPTDDSHCVATVADGGSSPPVTPTGSVKFTAERGSLRGDTCQLQPESRSASFASCSVTYAPPPQGTPAGTRIPVSAEYSGDASHQPSKSRTEGKDALQLVCVGLWTGACESVLPKPDPVQVCIALWQNCNGFGGAKPAKPGTIDIKGLPDSLKGGYVCVEGKKEPKGSVSQDEQRKTDKCLMEAELQSKDKRLIKSITADAKLKANKDTFSGLVRDHRAAALAGLAAACCTDKPLLSVLQQRVGQAYDQMAVAGRPGSTAFAIHAGLCDGSSDKIACLDTIDAVVPLVVADLKDLAAEKKALGLDKTAGADVKKLDATAAAKRRRARGVLAIARGSLVAAQGTRGRLTLRLRPGARKALRKLRRSGVRGFKATAVVSGTIIPGIARTKRVKVRVRLR